MHVGSVENHLFPSELASSHLQTTWQMLHRTRTASNDSVSPIWHTSTPQQVTLPIHFGSVIHSLRHFGCEGWLDKLSWRCYKHIPTEGKETSMFQEMWLKKNMDKKILWTIANQWSCRNQVLNRAPNHQNLNKRRKAMILQYVRMAR